MPRSPQVQTGESRLTSRGFQFSRVAYAQRTDDWSNAKVEQEVNDELAKAYAPALTPGLQSCLVPLGGEHLQKVDPGVAATIRQMTQAGVAGADPGEMNRVNQHSMWDDDKLGVMLGGVQTGEMIDLLRAREIFSRAGSREFTLPSNGRIGFPIHSGGADVEWLGEEQEISESNETTGMLHMQARKMAALVTVPNELIRFSTPSLEAFVRMDIADGMATKLDRTLLRETAQGQIRPKGLIHYDGVLSRNATTQATDGDTLEPQDLSLMVADLEEQDIDVNGFTFVSRPLLWAAIRNRRADAVAEDDGKGAFVFRTETDPRNGQSLDGSKFLRSTHVPNDREKGSSTDLTMLIGGVFREYLIGRVGVMEMAASAVAGNNFKTDQTSIRGIQFVDGRPRREEAFVIIDNLLNA